MTQSTARGISTGDNDVCDIILRFPFPGLSARRCIGRFPSPIGSQSRIRGRGTAETGTRAT